uniref:Uncharacterized protein n=1 Tax=Cacopsylla melanoneura TaxID=428564 RepID=A0A8D9BCA8_9HEMI
MYIIYLIRNKLRYLVPTYCFPSIFKLSGFLIHPLYLFGFRKMDFNTDITGTFKQYTFAGQEFKGENTLLQIQLQTLDKKIEVTEKFLQALNEDEADGDHSTLLDQMDRVLETEIKEKLRQEEELETSEKKFADLVKEAEEDEILHELEKLKIAYEKKTENENLIQEVKHLLNLCEASTTENTNLQFELITAENKHTKFQKDMEKLTESCSSLELAKVELESKISTYKENSIEKLLRVERYQCLRIEDLRRTNQQLVAQLNDLNNKKIKEINIRTTQHGI